MNWKQICPPPPLPPFFTRGPRPQGWPYLRSRRTASKVPGNEKVDNRPTDSLCSQDESQRPPEAQHFSYGCISLYQEMENKVHYALEIEQEKQLRVKAFAFDVNHESMRYT